MPLTHKTTREALAPIVTRYGISRAAELVGVHPSAISNWIHERSTISDETVEALIDALLGALIEETNLLDAVYRDVRVHGVERF